MIERLQKSIYPAVANDQFEGYIPGLVNQFQTNQRFTAVLDLPELARKLGPIGVEMHDCLFEFLDRETPRVQILGTIAVKMEYEGVDNQTHLKTEHISFSISHPIPVAVSVTAIAEGCLILESIVNVPEIDPEELWITQVITHLFFSVMVRIMEPDQLTPLVRK